MEAAIINAFILTPLRDRHMNHVFDGVEKSASLI